jgi:hypothetical protein
LLDNFSSPQALLRHDLPGEEENALHQEQFALIEIAAVRLRKTEKKKEKAGALPRRLF